MESWNSRKCLMKAVDYILLQHDAFGNTIGPFLTVSLK